MDFPGRRRDAEEGTGAVAPPPVARVDLSFPGGGGMSSPRWCLRSWEGGMNGHPLCTF